MSISLIGIILVQLYWINSSFQKNDDQFRHHALVVLNNVSEKLNNKAGKPNNKAEKPNNKTEKPNNKAGKPNNKTRKNR